MAASVPDSGPTSALACSMPVIQHPGYHSLDPRGLGFSWHAALLRALAFSIVAADAVRISH